MEQTVTSQAGTASRAKFIVGGLLIVAAIVYLIITSTRASAQYFLTVDELATTQFARADYRLGELTTTTLGLKYATPLSKTSEFSVRGEMINQVQNDVGVPTGYEATGLDLSPDLSAFVVQVGYSFHW